MARLASRERFSFGKLREVLALPDLIAVQRESFEWFLEEGVAEVLRDISPIEDFTGQLKLELADHVFDPPKHSEDECRERDMTFARPLFVTARFMNAGTGEIKEQTVFMGDFPMMTDRGTFIINGTERIVVSPARAFAGRLLRRLAGQDLAGEGHRRRQDDPGPWCVARVRGRQEGRRLRPHRPEAQAAGHGAAEGARVRRDRRGAPQPLPRPAGSAVRLDAQHARQGPHRGRGRRVHRHLPQAPSGRAADVGQRARPAREPVLQPEALRHGEGRPAQGHEEARRRVRQGRRHAQAPRHRGPERGPGRRTGRVHDVARPTSSPRSRTW